MQFKISINFFQNKYSVMRYLIGCTYISNHFKRNILTIQILSINLSQVCRSCRHTSPYGSRGSRSCHHHSHWWSRGVTGGSPRFFCDLFFVLRVEIFATFPPGFSIDILLQISTTFLP